jgi:hypothetical protein
MRVTFLEKLMIWLAKLAQIIEIARAKPNESHVETVRSILDPHPIYESSNLIAKHKSRSDYGPIE